MGDLRRCRWCQLILDPLAPPQSETIVGNTAGKRERRVRSHCPNLACDWCEPCVRRREALIKRGWNPNTAEPVE